MADDLVERLKRKGKLDAELLIQRRAFGHVHGLIEACAEAAARIARLEAALRPFADACRIERADGNITGRAEFTCCLSVRVGACLTAAAALADAPAPGQAKAPSGG